MAMDWTETIIEIPDGTDYWGPYRFDFKSSSKPLIPSALSIDSCEVKAYAGKQDKSADLSAETEITSYIVDTSTVVSGRYVDVYFQHSDESDAVGKNTIVFFITLSGGSGAVRPFYFYGVKIF